MKSLLLLRHAKSSWSDASVADHDRPLNDRGRRDAPRMGRLLVDQDLVPDVIHCSSAVRTRSTVESMWNNGQFTGDLRHHAALYEAAVDDVEVVLRSTSDGADRVLIVGHNPTMEELVARLTGQWERMPTATLAHIQLSIDTWSDFTVDCRGTLADLWRPRELSA